MVVHDTRMRQLPVQPQLPESTDRSRLVWWRDAANGEMVDNKLGASARLVRSDVESAVRPAEEAIADKVAEQLFTHGHVHLPQPASLRQRYSQSGHLDVLPANTNHKRIKRGRRHTARSAAAACHLGRRRQVRHVPAPAERLDELNARRHLLPAQCDGRLLVAEKRCLRRDDVEIGVDARAVPRRGEPQVPGR